MFGQEHLPLAASYIMICGIALAAVPAAFAEPANLANDLPTQVVTATRTNRVLNETPQAISILEEQTIAEANVSNTPDLFRYTDTVYIQRTNLGGGSPFIRGLTGEQVLILVDGVRLNNSFFRFGPNQYLNTIDPNLIERIEVVRGPNSVLYGSDALGGTINIITKKRRDFTHPQDADGLLATHFETAAEAGTFRAQAEGNWHQLGILFGATGKLFGDLRGGDGVGTQVPTGYDEADADLKLNYRFGEQDELILAEQYTRQFDVPITSEVTLGDSLVDEFEPQERSLTYLEYRSTQGRIFDQLKLNLSYNLLREGRRIIERSTPTLESRDLTEVGTYGATLQLENFLTDRHHFTYGFEYYLDTYNTAASRIDLARGISTPAAPVTPDGIEYQSWGVYLQDELYLSPKFDAILGIRYSDITAEGSVANTQLAFETNAVVGNINLLYRLTPSLRLVGSLAWGFRAPSIEDFFGRVDFFSEIPNTDLQPEESFNKEIGLKYDDGSFRGELFYFHTDYDGFIERVTVGSQPDGTPILQRRNTGESLIQGVELDFSYPFTPQWLLSGGFTWTEGFNRDTGRPLRRIPPLNGHVRLRHTPRSNLWFEAAAVLANEQDRLSEGDITDPRIGPDGTPGYAVFDLRAGYQPDPDQQILVSLENVGDARYQTHGSGIFNPGINLGLTYSIKF